MKQSAWLILGFLAASWAALLSAEILPECVVWRKSGMMGQAEAGEERWLVLYLEKMGAVWVRSGNVLPTDEECKAEEAEARAGGRYELKRECQKSRRAQWFLGEWINCAALPQEPAPSAESIGTRTDCLELWLWSTPEAKSPWQGEPLAAGQEVLLQVKTPVKKDPKGLKVQFYANEQPLLPLVDLSKAGAAALRVKLPSGRPLYSAALFQGERAQCASGALIVPGQP